MLPLVATYLNRAQAAADADRGVVGKIQLNPQRPSPGAPGLGLFLWSLRTGEQRRRVGDGGLFDWFAQVRSRSGLSVPPHGLIDGHVKADAGPGKQKIGSP